MIKNSAWAMPPRGPLLLVFLPNVTSPLACTSSNQVVVSNHHSSSQRASPNNVCCQQPSQLLAACQPYTVVEHGQQRNMGGTVEVLIERAAVVGAAGCLAKLRPLCALMGRGGNALRTVRLGGNGA